MAGKICFDVTGWMSQRRLNMHYISLIQNPIFRSLKGALPQLPRDSRRLKWREMGSLIIEYYRQIHLRDKTPTLLFWCDQWERTSVDNRLKTEPFLLRRWVGTNGSLKERCTTDGISTVSVWGEKRQLQNLWIILKQTITWPRDFLMLFTAYFILPKSNSSVK